MSFLAPWFWIGAFAIAAPIIFHLVRQHIRKRKQFSSLMFLQATQPKVKRRSRLEHLLLLALRVLLLLLLAAAFARPFFKSPADAADSSQAGEIVAVLLDTSASMQRGDLWSDATDLTRELVDEFRSARQVTLLGFDRQVTTLVSFDDWARADSSRRGTLWRERLSTAAFSQAGTHLGKALVTAAELIEDARSREQAGADTMTGRIVVISDLQEGSHLEGLAGFNWPARLTVELRSLEGVGTSNAGLHPVARDAAAALTLTATNESRVFVSNASDSTNELFRLSWIGGNGAQVGEELQIYLPPGQSRVARIALPAEQMPTRIRLAGDDEPFDNIIHVAPDKPDEVRVTVLGADDADQPGSLTFFLRRAFQSTPMQTVEFTAVTNVGSAAVAAPADLLVATDNPLIIPGLRQQLATGRSALLVLNRTNSAATLQSLLNLPALPVSEGQERNYALLARIEFTHPVFSPFLDTRFSDFSGIQFWRYRKIDPAALPGALVLAEFDSGDPALIELAVDGGNLFVLTTSWLQADSKLALSSKFVPLLYSMLELNHPPQPSSQERLIGDSLELADAPGATLVLPDGRTRRLDAGPDAATFEMPGIHELKLPDGKTRRYALNLDPAESRTGPLNEEELIRIGVPLHTSAGPVNPVLAARA
ncbi:MAG TPA: hypothetical protein DCY13_22045, partial [Verrucomicrobiales bacterium]|nr:hypothetical protein [Verrucomicrobiales bacterium]